MNRAGKSRLVSINKSAREKIDDKETDMKASRVHGERVLEVSDLKQVVGGYYWGCNQMGCHSSEDARWHFYGLGGDRINERRTTGSRGDYLRWDMFPNESDD